MAMQTISKAVGVVLVIGSLFVGAYFLIYKGPAEVAGRSTQAGYELTKQALSDLAEALQFTPRVIVGEKTLLQQDAKIRELATASRNFEHTYAYTHSWLGSTKTVELKGQFLAKAGFLVNDQFALITDEQSGTTVLRYPPAQLISCELQSVRVLKDENGWWNKLSPQEREEAQNKLISTAKEAAVKSGVLHQAVQNLAERLKPFEERNSIKMSLEPLP